MIAARPQRAVRPMPVRPCVLCTFPTRETTGLYVESDTPLKVAYVPLCGICRARGRSTLFKAADAFDRATGHRSMLIIDKAADLMDVIDAICGERGTCLHRSER